MSSLVEDTLLCKMLSIGMGRHLDRLLSSASPRYATMGAHYGKVLHELPDL